jgi:(4-(4-[2-(gamma-L-glutamylamino)ethyl]phenoxymethyl)furan-2-yl)methanamine synthase
VCAEHALAHPRLLVSAGCGAYLVNELASPTGQCLHYARDVARFARRSAPGAPAWAQVCAPSVAVAALYEIEHARFEPHEPQESHARGAR